MGLLPYCKAILTLGFGLKPSGKMKLANLQQCVKDQFAKGRSNHAFWRSMATEGESGMEPRGQRTDPPPSVKLSPGNRIPPSNIYP